MGTRFTRVTVVGDHRQIDISLPADSPVAGQLPTVLRLLSVPPGAVPVRWRLSAPEFGPLPPNRTLDESGVVDGAVLYLTEAAAAAPPPFVDDVERAIAQSVADSAPPWDGVARRSAIGWLLGGVQLAAVGLGFAYPAPVSWVAPALALLVSLVVGATIPGRGGLVAALVALPAGLGLVYGIAAARPEIGADGHLSPLALIDPSTEWVGFRLVLAVVLAAGVAVVGALRHSPGAAVGGLIVTTVGALAFVADRTGLPAVRTAGVGLAVAVSITGMAGQLALGGAGLVNLMRADEDGHPVPRDVVRRSVDRGLALAGGTVWAAAIVGAFSSWELLVGGGRDAGGWIGPALGGLGGLIFALRARMFTRAVHVAPMLGVAVVAAVATAIAAPDWFHRSSAAAGGMSLAVLLVAGGVLVGAGFASLSEVAGARVARLLERCELLSVLALVPGLVLLFRVIPTVQQWWS